MRFGVRCLLTFAVCAGVFWLALEHSYGAQAGIQREPTTGLTSPSIEAVRTSGPVLVDGLLEEAVWSQAVPASSFLQKDPLEGDPATERTEVRTAYDTQNLYIGIVCHDSNPDAIRATELRRDDSLNNDDIFELILDTYHDHRNGYLFRVNPLGTQYDASITDEGRRINADWDERWEARARVTETGWTAEIMIPFKIIRFQDENPLTWGINFHRTIKRKNEDVFWTAHSRNYSFNEVSRAGHLTGLSDIQGFTFRFKPYFSAGINKTFESGLGETDRVADVGIEDAKYMITPQLALDLTVNPDFAQADVDQAQSNLTRFSLFFPERREFFQEGAGIFQFGTTGGFGPPDVLLFHSRRIGLSPDREPIPIRGGLKLTGRQGPFDIGLLNMQTGRFGSVAGQNFTVARVKGNVFARSYIGAMMTRNSAGTGEFSNRAGGLDASFTFLQNLNVQGFLARNDAPGVSDGEWAGYAEAEWDSDRFELSVEYLDLDENFLPEMGFVSRAEPDWNGVKRSFVQASYSPRPASERIRQFEFAAELDYITNQRGVLDTRSIETGWTIDFQSGDAVQFEWNRTFERLVRPLRIRGTGRTVPAGDYRTNEYSMMVRAFRGRAISGNMRIETGGFYNGSNTSVSLSPQLKPTQNLSIDPEYEWNRISLPGAPAFVVSELNTNMNYAFTQKWLTRTTVLLNSQDTEYAINFRLNYIFRPGDDLFIIYNETRSYGSQAQLQNRALVVKATFSLDY